MTGYQVALEILLVGLLASMLFYVARLERALKVVRGDKVELEQLLNDFNESTQHATNGVTQLRKVADEVSNETARKFETAQSLQTDLMHLIERGETLASQLASIEAPEFKRDLTSSKPSRPTMIMIDQQESRTRSQAERDLLRALRISR